MFKEKLIKLTCLLAAALMLSGCGLTVSTNGNNGAGSGSGTDGGVFKSTNKGINWSQKTSIKSVDRAKTFSGVDIGALALDPQDSQAIYAGSIANGLFFSYDGAEGWQLSSGLGSATINDLAIDPKDKCTIYAASGNKVFKSIDCSRTWSGVYFDNDLAVKIISLAIDPSNSKNVFIGTSRGEVIKSSDAGSSWQTVGRFESQVEKIAVNPSDAKIMYAGTASKGVFRSLDGGANWASLDDKLKTFNDAKRFRDLALVKGEKNSVFLATSYGILKSTDDGNTWLKIELITPEKDAKINSLAINPSNTDEIYYATDTTFYRSLDGGKNWTSRKLPTNRAGAKLLIDPKNPSNIYLAAKKVK